MFCLQMLPGWLYRGSFYWILCSCSSLSQQFLCSPNFTTNNISTCYTHDTYGLMLNLQQVILFRLVDVACIHRYFHRLCDQVWHLFRFPNPFSLTYPSVKWIGLFVTAVVGLYTIEDLWDKFGDLRMTNVRLATFCDAALIS